MILKVYNEKESEEKVALLKLELIGDRIALFAVDPEGRHLRKILTINSTGTLTRYNCVYRTLDFQSDSEGRIIERDY